MAIKSNPVTQSLEFKTHVDQVEKEFNFLVSEFGFSLSQNEFIGKEFWIVYSKDPLAIEILFEKGKLPFVTLRNNSMPHDEELYIDNGDSVEEYSVKAQQIKNSRYERKNALETRVMDTSPIISNLALKELNDDYALFGHNEHIEYLKEAALTVRKNLESKRGHMGKYSTS
ncbi:hypothetical protein LV84_02182 [Algoriphagus ratkowskyi]|uniref:Uncharacterized protein n=1 Tax=Algoriphagus ratkowskyi TaxID=57028 RepID=A0A2W7RAL4_9BACT|nr:hypothetical protein [Algoriphagus ratkowskyi]PZX57051.1 hypothetical protein LV84_02182 [Algoriphagus ratkowskyi]TXD79948.1 hypothetical protein ESW18_02125 [Algoriphagus ratkowskyi]